jgi:hypothetical protein
MFPYHGHPLSWYDFAESINPENHDIAVAAAKKVDSKLKQAATAATTEYNKKQKCVELEKVEREKAMQISDLTTNQPIRGVVAGFDASLAVKVGDFVNVSADLSDFKMSHGGKGFVTDKETKDGVSSFTVKYLETESGSRNQTESGITVSRLTVTPFAVFDGGPKRRPGNELVVTPNGDSTTAEHPTNNLKTCLEEAFLKGWAKGWRRKDFPKQTMSRAEISEKNAA